VKALIFGVFLGVAVAMASPLAAQDEGIAMGKNAPVVSVPDLDGRAVDLGQYIGKRPMMLEFWATWCPICEALLPRVQAAHQKYGSRVAFLGINVAVNQTRDRVRRYMASHQLPFQVLYDEDGVSTRAYDAPQTSYIVIVDSSGRVAYTGVGTEQRFEEALQRVAGN
jgi:thiol-disulfide isomerase/thioredoxin